MLIHFDRNKQRIAAEIKIISTASYMTLWNWRASGNSREKVYFQQLYDNIWRSPVGRSHRQPRSLHEASIVPAIARRQFRFPTTASLQLNSYYGDYVSARKQHVCRSEWPAPASAANHRAVTGLAGRRAIIFRTLRVPAAGNLLFIDVTVPLQAPSVALREISLVC